MTRNMVTTSSERKKRRALKVKVERLSCLAETYSIKQLKFQLNVYMHHEFIARLYEDILRSFFKENGDRAQAKKHLEAGVSPLDLLQIIQPSIPMYPGFFCPLRQKYPSLYKKFLSIDPSCEVSKLYYIQTAIQLLKRKYKSLKVNFLKKLKKWNKVKTNLSHKKCQLNLLHEEMTQVQADRPVENDGSTFERCQIKRVQAFKQATQEHDSWREKLLLKREMRAYVGTHMAFRMFELDE